MLSSIIGISLWIAHAWLVAYLAKERNRNFTLWMILGLVLGPLAWILFYFFIPPESKTYQ